MPPIDHTQQLSSLKLDRAYRATTYRVFLPGGVADIRIGEANARLKTWLAAEAAESWAILTAYNPGSQLQESALNAERQSELECALLEQGYLTFAGENRADEGGWPDEESCLVVDISMKNSMALAGRFRQNALVFGKKDGIAHLLWVNEEKERMVNE